MRATVAARYLRGSGIEIGALHEPIALPPSVSVRYVDRLTIRELRVEFPELADHSLVDPDIIDDGETLGAFAAASVDFIAANHFFEHCEDPIRTLENQLRVVSPGGVIFLGIPDKRRTFDEYPPLTTLQHLVLDYRNGPAGSRWAHYLEYAALTDGADDPGARARYLSDRNYRIHFHVWTRESFSEFLGYCCDELRLPFTTETVTENDFEFIAVLRRSR